MADEGMITEKEAVLRVEPKQLDSLLHPQFDPAALKAAAVINGKDPFKAGLVEKDGKTLPMPRRMESFVTHLADHDWVLSVPAAQWTVDALKQVAVRSYGIKEADLTKKPFNQFRNYVLSQKTAMQLYGAYSTKGLDGLTAEVAEIVRA